MLRDQNKDLTNNFDEATKIDISSSNSIAIVESEKRIHPFNSEINNINSESNIFLEAATAQKHLASDIHSINPHGMIVPSTNQTDTPLYIADLEKQLKLALENNKRLENKNQELVEQLSFEKADNEKEKEKRLELEEKLRVEKEAREEEIKLRKKIEEEFRLQAAMKEEKCRGLEAKLKINETKFKNEMALAQKECEKIERVKEHYKTEVINVYMELGERDRKMGEMKQDITILTGIKDDLKSRIEEYKKERDMDLKQLSVSLHQLKTMTKPFLERFRRRPSKKHQKINQCIIAVNERIACCP